MVLGGLSPLLVLLGFHLLIISPKTMRVLREYLETGHNPLPFLWQPHLCPEFPTSTPLQGWLCWLEEGDLDHQEEAVMDNYPPGAHGPPLCSQDVLLAKSFTEGPEKGSEFQHLPLPRGLRAPQVPYSTHWCPSPVCVTCHHPVCRVWVHLVHPISSPANPCCSQ